MLYLTLSNSRQNSCLSTDKLPSCMNYFSSATKVIVLGRWKTKVTGEADRFYKTESNISFREEYRIHVFLERSWKVLYLIQDIFFYPEI